MKHTVWKGFFNYEKEEKYLNEMSSKGLALVSYFWCRYVFEDEAPGKYIYRIELLPNTIKNPASQRYISFMEENGVEFVASYFRWVYFRKNAADGNFDIYSDLESKIGHYRRVRALFLSVMLLNFYPGLTNFAIGIDTMITRGTLQANLLIGTLNLILSTILLFFVVIPITKEIHELKREKEIHE